MYLEIYLMGTINENVDTRVRIRYLDERNNDFGTQRTVRIYIND
jgi:hypothetical protein